MVPRGCSAVPMTPFSPHGDPSAPRRPLQTKSLFAPPPNFFQFRRHANSYREPNQNLGVSYLEIYVELRDFTSGTFFSYFELLYLNPLSDGPHRPIYPGFQTYTFSAKFTFWTPRIFSKSGAIQKWKCCLHPTKWMNINWDTLLEGLTCLTSPTTPYLLNIDPMAQTSSNSKKPIFLIREKRRFLSTV